MSRGIRLAVRLAVGVAGLATLSSCATFGTNVRGNFSCAAPDGICAPSSVIDDRALAMIAGEPGALQPAGPFERAPAVMRRDAVADGSAPVSRVGQKVLAILFPAHVDSQGRYHETSTVRAVVDSGAWVAAVEGRGTEFAHADAVRVTPAAAAGPTDVAVALEPVTAVPAPDEVAEARARGRGRRAGHATPATNAAANAAKSKPINQPSGFSGKVED